MSDPVDLVILLHEQTLVVRVENPMVGADVEGVCVSNLLLVSCLDLRKLHPLNHRRLQVHVVVDSIVVELFRLDLVRHISELAVHPVENVEGADTGLKQLHVHEARDNVDSEETLDLHDVLVELLDVETGQKLDHQFVLLQYFVLPVRLLSRRVEHLKEDVHDCVGYLKPIEVAEVRIAHEHKQPTGAHKLSFLAILILFQLIHNEFGHLEHLLAEQVLISLVRVFKQLEVKLNCLVVNLEAHHTTLSSTSSLLSSNLFCFLFIMLLFFFGDFFKSGYLIHECVLPYEVDVCLCLLGLQTLIHVVERAAE